MTTRQLFVFDSPQQLSEKAAQGWIDQGNQAILDNGAFHIALSGGSTPKRLFKVMAQPTFAQQLEWSKIHIYFGDERCVPADHPDSNYKMAFDELLSHVPCPADNIHRMAGELDDPATAAHQYSQTLIDNVPLDAKAIPCFDLIFLGIGTDGHTASLFPESDALFEEHKLAVANYVEKLQSWRLTLTYPTINNAKKIIVLAEGEQKADLIHEIFTTDTHNYPIQKVIPKYGDLMWYVDKDAAKKMPN